MNREHTNKNLKYSQKYPKNTKVINSAIKKIVNENMTDVFIQEAGLIEIDGKKLEFQKITIYLDMEN